ncbi:MAG: energy transducer TonB [Deltaproteobacteria bacterium]|nr:energy transducer TonB [Deltaproteobacteria bacterium]
MTWAIAATVAVHGALGAVIASLPDEEPEHAPTVIEVREVKREPPPPPKAPAPPPPPAPQELARPAPPPPKAAPPPPAPPKAAPPKAAPAAPAPAVPANLNLTLGNGGDGPAVPPPAPPAPQAPPAPVVKTLVAPPPAGEAACGDPVVKARPLHVVQPAFTQEARDAGVTGKVRVEIAISAAGQVVSARVIAGLGHGLDEAALEAARASTFAPATQCGRPVATTFTIGMRFQ